MFSLVNQFAIVAEVGTRYLLTPMAGWHVFIIKLYDQSMIWSSLKGDGVLPHRPSRIDMSTKSFSLITAKFMCPNEFFLKHLESMKMICSFLFLLGLVGK